MLSYKIYTEISFLKYFFPLDKGSLEIKSGEFIF